MTLTAYELEREERMRMIKQTMQQMGLDDTLNEIKSAVKAQQQVRRPVIRQSPRPLTAAERQARRLAIRRSDRNAGKPAPDYRLQSGNGYAVEYTPRSRSSRINRSGTYSRAVLDSNAGWNPSKGLASSAAATAANEAAEALVDEIESQGGHAYAKIMTSSQVSSGFWANSPRGVEQHITFLEKTPISLKLPDDSEDTADAVYQRDDGTWHCVWLPRKTGAGFSGGWRGFAIDLDLFPGDVCVFEIDESTKNKKSNGGSVDALIVHIFRAFEYDSESVREQRKQQAAEEAENEESFDAEDIEDEEALELQNEESEEEEEEEIMPVGKNRGAYKTNVSSVEESEEEERAMKKSKNKREARSRNTKTRIVIAKRKKRPTSDDEEDEDNEKKEVEEVKRLQATTYRQTIKSKQSRATTTAAATAAKKSSRSTKKQKKNPPPASAAIDIEIEEEEGELGDTELDNDDGDEGTREEIEYIVEKIMDVRTESDGTKRFFIKWYGYPHSQNSWEPIVMLNAAPEKYPRAPRVQL